MDLPELLVKRVIEAAFHHTIEVIAQLVHHTPAWTEVRRAQLAALMFLQTTMIDMLPAEEVRLARQLADEAFVEVGVDKMRHAAPTCNVKGGRA